MAREHIRELVAFHFVDPTLLSKGKTVEAATVKTIYALTQDRLVDRNPHLSTHKTSRLINRNIVDLAHTRSGRKQLEELATEPGTINYIYCSRCGRGMTQEKCATCGIQFSVSEGEGVGGTMPIVPAKVVAYARRQGYTFTKKPPSA
jgi:hypothetical protein